MDRFERFRIFLRVAESGSFTQAAADLRLPRSTVSVAIQELESHLGARLLHRTTRHVALTADGAAFQERAERLLSDLEETEGLFRIRSGGPCGNLRIDAPMRMARRILAPALPGFLAAYPEMTVEFGATDRPVDLIQEGVDCTIRVGEITGINMLARLVGELQLVNCASPDYLARYGVPECLADLRDHLAVGYASPFNGRVVPFEFTESGQKQELAMRAVVTANNAEMYVACCLAGLGLIQVPAYDVREDLDEGRLVEVMPSFRAPPMPVSILYLHRLALSRRLKVFVDWVTELLRQQVLQPSPR